MKTFRLALLVTAIFCQPVLAGPRSVLDMQLVEGAKKETKLVFYTTIDLPQTIAVADAFIQKYPFWDLSFTHSKPTRWSKKFKTRRAAAFPHGMS